MTKSKVFGPGVFSTFTPFHTEQIHHEAFIVYCDGKQINRCNIGLLDIKDGVQTARIIGYVKIEILKCRHVIYIQ